MHILVRPLFLSAFFLLLSAHTTACVDSLWCQIEPVKCYGLRDGKISVNKVFGGLAPYYYSIDGQSFSTNPKFDHLWAGDYIIFVRDASGCVTTLALEMPEPSEMLVRLQTNDSSVVAGKPFVIQAIVSPEILLFQSIEWLPFDFFTKQDTLRQQIVLSKPTNFSVRLVDKNGCGAQNSLFIEVESPNIYIPNAIKPGSDQDAFLTVFAGEGVKKVSALRVFNRIGATLFERLDFQPNDPLKGWNGRWQDKKVQPGVYLWLADIVLLDNNILHLEGTVTVVE